MKKILSLLVVAAVVASVVVLAGCAGTPKAMSNEEAWRKFVGEWVNLQYVGRNPDVQKWEIGSDLVVRWFGLATQTDTAWAFRVKIKKQWEDADGNTCCQVFFKFIEPNIGEGLALYRVDAAGKVFEVNAIPYAPEEGKAAEVALKHLEKIDPELSESLKKMPGIPISGDYHIYDRK
jgi:hypothetical protein